MLVDFFLFLISRVVRSLLKILRSSRGMTNRIASRVSASFFAMRSERRQLF